MDEERDGLRTLSLTMRSSQRNNLDSLTRQMG